jgi:group I intron endonuclease
MNYNFVYITTNLVNGKQYVGDHSTNDLDDGYLGSGLLIQKSVSKYGKKNFERKIIKICETKEEAFNLQKKYINEYNTLSPNGYNISPKGGVGVNGCHASETKEKIRGSLRGIPKTKEHIENIRKILGVQGAWNKGIPISEDMRDKIVESNKKRREKNHPMYGKTHTEESKEKMRGHRGQMNEIHKQNMSNSHKGKFYINDGIITKQLKKGDQIPSGWELGRKKKF